MFKPESNCLTIQSPTKDPGPGLYSLYDQSENPVADALSGIKQPKAQKFIVDGQIALAIKQLDDRLVELDILKALVDATKE
ncbi:MAG: hypothetical protein K8F91_23300 [Candidatus Obscuribacterales bacterium]|nr:hypothetical protein [Candidatus Obscuribacterales bacterium]